MGRRNWLFAGSDEGAERAAIILTVLETAARQGVDLQQYLHDVLVKISHGWLQSRLDELLPENWAAARAQATSTTQPAPPSCVLSDHSAAGPLCFHQERPAPAGRFTRARPRRYHVGAWSLRCHPDA